MAIENNNNKVLNVPVLRFPEFTEDWKSTTIKNACSEFQSGKNIKAEMITCKGLYPVYGGNGLRGFTGSYNHEGDYVLIGRQGALCGNIRKVTGRTYITEHAIAVCASEENDTAFLQYLFQRMKLGQYSDQSAQPGLAVNKLLRLNIKVPSKIEQVKIAKVLSLLDERISTQNKIIEDLKKLKSAIVEMILCKQGGVLLKLGDVGSFIRGLTYSSEDIAEDINATTVIRANNLNYGNNVSKKDVVYVNKKPTEIQILRKGDIVICMANGSSSLVGKNSYYSFDDRHSTIGAFCGIYRTSQPLVKWLMQSQIYKRLVYQSLQGGNGAIANLNGDDILNMTFRVVEHEKSISILSALNLVENSITVNENLQELYSRQKIYLLQHLFI